MQDLQFSIKVIFLTCVILRYHDEVNKYLTTFKQVTYFILHTIKSLSMLL